MDIAETILTELRAIIVEQELRHGGTVKRIGLNKQFPGFVASHVERTLAQLGFIRNTAEEGYHTGKLAMTCWAHLGGGKASVTEANFFGRFTELEIRNVPVTIEL